MCNSLCPRSGGADDVFNAVLLQPDVDGGLVLLLDFVSETLHALAPLALLVFFDDGMLLHPLKLLDDLVLELVLLSHNAFLVLALDVHLMLGRAQLTSYL